MPPFLVIFVSYYMRTLSHMKPRSRKKKILRLGLIVASIPIIIIGLLVALLYIPPVQRFVVDKVCEEISEASGYNIEIGAIRLSFPFNLKATDLKISKNDSIYLQGESIDADISLLPILRGNLEINQLSFENIEVHTRDLIAKSKIDGNIGFVRMAVRDVDLSKSIANIKQLHIQRVDLNITLPDTVIDKTVNNDPIPQWVINLRNGNIKECRVSLSIPADSINTTLDIEKLQLKHGEINTARKSLSIEDVLLSASRLNYDMGNGTQEEEPLKHIELENISLNAGNLLFSEKNTCATITGLFMEQPGGLTITDATAHLTSSNDSLLLHNLDINSLNGSHIHGEFIIPQQTMYISIDKRFTAELSARVNKRDLVKFVEPEVYESLSMFNEEMFNAHIAMSGNVHNIGFDTITLQFPGIGTIEGNGCIKNILRQRKVNANFAFNGNIENIAKIIGNTTGKGNDNITIGGNIHYKNKRIDADMTMAGNAGNIGLDASYNIADTTYKAGVRISQLALTDILPNVPLHNLAMTLNAKGKGFDLFNGATRYEIEATVDTLDYSGYKFRSLSASATQKNGVSLVDIRGNDNSLRFNIHADTRLKPAGLDNQTSIELAMADFKQLGMSEAELKTSTNIDITAATDLNQTHSLKITGRDTKIITRQYSFTPAELSFEFNTSPKNTDFKVTNGDLNANGKMDCGYTTFFASIDKVAQMYDRIISGSDQYNLRDIERVLPQMNLHIECSKNNMLHNYLAFNGIGTGSMNLDLNVSPMSGLYIKSDIYKLSSGSLELDSIRITTVQESDKLRYFMGIKNLSVTSFEEENNYSAMLRGSISDYTVTAALWFRDNIKELDSKLGTTVHLAPQGINMHFDSEAQLLGTPYLFNKDNYINIGKGMDIEADVLVKNSNNSGLHLFTTPDATSKYNASLNIFNIELSKLTNSIPGLPEIAGSLFAEINYRGDNKSDRLNCDLKIDSLGYEGNNIGNERVRLTYTSYEGNSGNADLTLSHNNRTVAHINSDIDISTTTFSNGKITLTQFPLAIANAIIGEEGASINGYMNSSIDISGSLDNIVGNGFLNFDSTYIYIPLLGTTLRPSEENITIKNSQINFNRFQIYDKSSNPFVINGTVNIANPLDPVANLRLTANNYEVLNTPRMAGKSFYGKMSIDLRSIIRGTINDLHMSGSITVLSNSDFAYVLPESAFETEKELEGLVEFVNFNDTTAIVQEKLPEVDLGDIDANFNITIKEGAKLALDFDAARENYITFNGDGTLNATYNEGGLNVTGIYKLNSGDLKLTLPIIPLKTFHIQEGGRLTWTGNLFNPTLDITALEKTTVSVEFEDNSIQPVIFYTGVVLSKTVENIGIDFTMSSPDNSIIQDQLNKLNQETLSKYAVAMIITGTYLGGRQGVTATSALSSFLDAKINDLSGEAIKNFDVNIGINDGLDAQTGNSYKNYSFSFSKRFFNDRITVVIGGEVNSGDRPDRDASNNSIINNVSLEWKLNDSGNRYMRIFYDKNYRSILEGEITETGIGYIYKRKLNKLKELFNFRKKKNTRTRTSSEATPKESK